MYACVHDFRCTTCGALETLLEAQVEALDQAARAALGYLVLGQPRDAERAIRAALGGHEAPEDKPRRKTR